MDGVIVVDKPQGWTSHDVVGKMRRLAGTRKIGHLGTLDPMATGVLPLVIERATRLAQFFVKNDKVYEGTVRFGFATDSYDADGTPAGPAQEGFVARAEAIEPLLERFRGTFLQTPPPISAKKIHGQPAYKLARRNVEVVLQPVEVTVHELTLLGVEGPDARLRVHCSSGTYLRSIAHELGIAAGVGAHLAALRRLRSGDFSIEQARDIGTIESLAQEGRFTAAMVPAAELLPGIPNEMVDRITETQIRQGRDFRVSPFRIAKSERLVKALSEDGRRLVAIGEARLPSLYHPIVVL